MKILLRLVAGLVAVTTTTCFSSCSLDVRADGSKSFKIDGEQAARAILVLSEK